MAIWQSGRSKASTKHVVIVGAGFAGLACAKALAGKDGVQVTLIDRNNYNQFQPLLYQVATGILSSNNAAFNVRAILQNASNIDIKMSEVVSVDLRRKVVTGKLGDTYQADYLVLAAGAEANFLGIKGAKEYTFPLYSLDDAERLRSELIRRFEQTELGHGDAVKLSFVIVGSGPTGVETAGALADLLQKTPQNLFSNARLDRIQITIVDGGKAPLRPFKPRSQSYALQALEERGVKLVFGRRVQEVTPNQVILSDGAQLDADITIWAGGLQAASLSSSIGANREKSGRLEVSPSLNVPGFTDIYALGDFASCPGCDGKPLPQLGSVAKQAGDYCGRTILSSIRGREWTPFLYQDKGIMAMIGRKAAIVELGPKRRVFYGFPAFATWQLVHVTLLPSLRIALQAIAEWTLDFWGSMHLNAIISRSADQPKR